MAALGHSERAIGKQRLHFWKNIVDRTTKEGGSICTFLDLFSMPRSKLELTDIGCDDKDLLDLITLNDRYTKELTTFIHRWDNIITKFHAYRTKDNDDV